MKTALALSLLALVTLARCGSRASVGQACATVASTSECVDGAICTNGATGNTCRQVCTSNADCTAPQTCNGISGTTAKSCQ